MSGWIHKVTDFLTRRNKQAEESREERDALEDELKKLSNEARYHEEPAFESDTQRRRDDLERETRQLFYAMEEPARSMLQGRCQKYLEEIERPETVRNRIEEVKTRLAELRQQMAERDATDMGERVAS